MGPPDAYPILKTANVQQPGMGPPSPSRLPAKRAKVTPRVRLRQWTCPRRTHRQGKTMRVPGKTRGCRHRRHLSRAKEGGPQGIKVLALSERIDLLNPHA